MKNKFALLVDSFCPSQETQNILQELVAHPEIDITIFSISKENIVPNPYPVFSMCDLYNFSGYCIITSYKTFKKHKSYPTNNGIIIGSTKYEGYLNIPKFDINLINQVIKENEKN